MLEPTKEELIHSITSLSGYRDRLKKEYMNILRKLGIPEEKIIISLKENQKLIEIEEILQKLIYQQNNKNNSQNQNLKTK
tara:strand:- start:314 stop:553 length:240 start_codon:yes stop_codon:yes gene_type:complete